MCIILLDNVREVYFKRKLSCHCLGAQVAGLCTERPYENDRAVSCVLISTYKYKYKKRN